MSGKSTPDTSQGECPASVGASLRWELLRAVWGAEQTRAGAVIGTGILSYLLRLSAGRDCVGFSVVLGVALHSLSMAGAVYR